MYKKRNSKQIYKLFEKIADNYDASNLRISLGLHKLWKNLIINDISKRIGIGGNILDICCGTGDIAIGIAKKRKDMKITGIDFSSAMLNKAKQKSQNLYNITWQKANAMKLPYSDKQFDAACISFGLRNTEDYKTVLLEMKRVIKKEAYLYCLDSFVPECPIIKPLYNVYFQNIMPFLGGGIKKNKEYIWLYQSTQIFLEKEKLAKLFQKIGLRNVRIKSKMFGACALIYGKNI